MQELNYKVVQRACDAIGGGNLAGAKEMIRSGYPFTATQSLDRRYSDKEKTKVFIRDGFIDRYSGERLVYPPVLRLLSSLMPEEFPFHSNWKMSECHIAYWQLYPTIDHIVPVTRGGIDEESNWVCTSQIRNSAKANWLLEELGWELQPPGDLQEWDGLFHWFLEYVEQHPEIKEDSWLRSWGSTARSVYEEQRSQQGRK
ncbi:HNH endonuclease [Gimesia chilikensis]|uniref:HNH endonuclease n=1 Tax=Gimesia chilikensis TaxID=2605989 RepID=UPI003A90692C